MAGMNHHDLIDTTEMYLRTVLELEEEGIIPLRARIAEHLRQAAPTVSQTIARMERDDLITLDDDRRIRLTPQGRLLAERVMRKHRLAECFLADVLGLEWQLIHDEACRWEHVMSEAAERRLLDLLGHPTHSPYGNPIPALDELGAKDEDAAAEKLVALASLPASTTSVVIRRIGESLQPDTAHPAGRRRPAAQRPRPRQLGRPARHDRRGREQHRPRPQRRGAPVRHPSLGNAYSGG
jgi:DtxR family Mn-dependent transcriptional regulator